MKWNLAAALLTVVVMDMRAAPPADACGVKLTIKSQAPRKAIARTSNPSDVLLLGTPSRRLEADLSAAGHRVDVAPNTAAAKKKSYAVVMVDSSMQDEARSSFTSSVVVVRSGDVTADVRSIERQVGRKPLRADEGRTVVAARPNRTPIAAGGQDGGRKLVSTSESKDPPAEVAPTLPPQPPQPEKVTTPSRPAEVKPDVTPPVEPKPRTVEPKPKAVAKATPHRDEVYFGYNRYGVGSNTLVRTLRWLKDNPDVSVVIEGHADPTGTAEDNLKLGQRRAELVRDQLVAAGIDASRLEVVSYGDTRLKYPSADSRNRRVAIIAK